MAVPWITAAQAIEVWRGTIKENGYEEGSPIYWPKGWRRVIIETDSQKALGIDRDRRRG